MLTPSLTIEGLRGFSHRKTKRPLAVSLAPLILCVRWPCPSCSRASRLRHVPQPWDLLILFLLGISLLQATLMCAGSASTPRCTLSAPR